MSKNKTVSVKEALIKYSNRHLGQIVLAKDIVEEVNWVHGISPESILPADFVSNPPDNRTTKLRNIALFTKVGRGNYFCLGFNPKISDKVRFLRSRCYN